MIKNAPKPEIFLSNSAEFMFEAIQIIYSLTKNDFNTFVENDLAARDDGEEDWLEVTHSVKIGTISLLIFSSIENYLKYKICTESPFLLISSLSDLKKSKTDFNEYHMHGFEDLLKVYITIFGITDNDSLKNKFEKLRKIRNLFVHSTLNGDIKVQDLFECAAFFVKEVWNKNLSKHPTLFYYFAEKLDPLFDYNDVENFDSIFEEDNDSHAELLTMLEILLHYLTINEALSFLGLSKIDKLEECPVCCIYSWRNMSIKSFRFSKLIVEEEENYLFCQLCQAKVLVSEEDPKNLSAEDVLPTIEQSQQTGFSEPG